MGAPLEVVRGYYAALGTDADAIAAYFTDDAVHYTRLGSHEGGRCAATRAK